MSSSLTLRQIAGEIRTRLEPVLPEPETGLLAWLESSQRVGLLLDALAVEPTPCAARSKSRSRARVSDPCRHRSAGARVPNAGGAPPRVAPSRLSVSDSDLLRLLRDGVARGLNSAQRGAAQDGLARPRVRGGWDARLVTARHAPSVETRGARGIIRPSSLARYPGQGDEALDGLHFQQWPLWASPGHPDRCGRPRPGTRRAA